MKPILSDANRSFRDGDLRAALGLYQACLQRFHELGDGPKSLITFCEGRIRTCGTLLHPPSFAGRDDDVSTTLPTKSVSKVVVTWDETAFNSGSPALDLPSVSIIIPHYNSNGLIYQALDSIAAQNFHDIETLVIDDNSTDGSLSNQRFASYPKWMRLRVVRLQANGGPARSRNIGVRLSEGRGICLLDADDWLDDSTLAARWRVVDQDPAIAAAFSTMSYADADGKSLGTVILKGADAFSYSDFTSNKFPCSALLFRRRALVLDPFDESLVYGEDYECFSRIAQRGGLYHVAPGTVWYRQHGASLTHRDAIKDLEHRLSTTRRVHARELSWSHVRFTRTLPEALVTKETSLRAFPVACVYALRALPDKAAQLGTHIDPDVIASRSPLEVAKSIRFFITREEFQPADQLATLLSKSDTECLRHFFRNFFFLRHQNFVSELVRHLLPATPKSTKITIKATAPWLSCSWDRFLEGPGSNNDWRGYILLHRSDEHMPEAARQAATRLLSERPDLEGLYIVRLGATGEELLTDINSIGPAAPDAIVVRNLGTALTPALVLHELAARALWAWLAHPPEGAGVPLASDTDPTTIERRALAGVFALRLKVAGGVPACHVLCNHQLLFTR